jgi:hypothetical protein
MENKLRIDDSQSISLFNNSERKIVRRSDGHEMRRDELISHGSKRQRKSLLTSFNLLRLLSLHTSSFGYQTNHFEAQKRFSQRTREFSLKQFVR